MLSHIRVRAGALIMQDEALLMVKYDHPTRGVFYDFPAGGAEPGESLSETVLREAKEEANADVIVGPIAVVYEYVPQHNQKKYGSQHTLVMLFDCKLQASSVPSLPATPDPYEVDVVWLPLSQMHEVELYANIAPQLLDYVKQQRSIELIEEHTL
ncbi:NUDIX hydrolase [Fictibacillus macauensis ZFHKF-1]|uniref:NUDIX hydrolase n=2 Tax=Fictibacillus TaxID=1329200 RepID=I8J358_9BACL|nr:NUDIX hydrolase [Fictibacillus macauensis ZFHKF-1]